MRQPLLPRTAAPCGGERAAPAVDRVGIGLLVAAFAVAPLEIWALFTVGGHGVTLLHCVALLFAGLSVVRWRRLAALPTLATYLLLVMLAWGVVAATLQVARPDLGRSLRNALLFALSLAAYAGASTVRLDWGRLRRWWRPGTWVYAGTVLFAVYQTFARRYSLPLAFLPITNPSFATDPSHLGVQHGATAAAAGWGEYFFRAAGTFSEPSALGRYLAYGLAVSLALTVLGGTARRTGFLGAALAAAGLLANGSLNGLLAYLAVGAAFVCTLAVRLELRNLFRFALAAGVFGLLGVALAPNVVAMVVERLATLSVDDSSGRFTQLPFVWSLVIQRPWGAGIAGVPWANEIHSGLMLYVVQYGVLGALPPLLWLGSLALGLHTLMWRGAAREARAGLTMAITFLAAHLASWVSAGALHDPFPWIASGFAFGVVAASAAQAAVRSRARHAGGAPP